jgi:DNA-binding MarR family transcriptional regulator
VLQYTKPEGSRLTDIAQRAGLTKPTVLAAVDDLQRLGYVERLPDPADGRAKLVRLTPRGAATAAEGARIIARVETTGTNGSARGALVPYATPSKNCTKRSGHPQAASTRRSPNGAQHAAVRLSDAGPASSDNVPCAAAGKRRQASRHRPARPLLLVQGGHLRTEDRRARSCVQCGSGGSDGR